MSSSRIAASCMELTPADVLVFPQPTAPQARAPTASLTVRNGSWSQAMAFKIQVTNPQRFTTTPSRGTLAPGASVAISITLCPQTGEQWPTKVQPLTEKFLVQCVGITKQQLSDDVDRILKETNSKDWVQKKLRCQFASSSSPSSSTTTTASSALLSPLVVSPPPPPPLPKTPRDIRNRSRSRSRSRSGSGDGKSRRGLTRTNSGNSGSGSARHLDQLQQERSGDETRRKKLLTFRDDHVYNQRCFNCVDSPERPVYVCLDFATFVCTSCSRVHRDLEHRVKSITMSKFTDDEVDVVLQSGGNAAAQAKWRKTYSPSFKIPGATAEERSRNAVYLTFVQRAWTGETPQANIPSAPPQVVPSAAGGVGRGGGARASLGGPQGTTGGAVAPGKYVPPRVTPSKPLATGPIKTTAPPAPPTGTTPWDKLLPSLCKTWPWLQGVSLTPQWTGDDVCIPPNATLEKQLRDKVAFIQTSLSLPTANNGGLFSGIQILRNLATKFPEADLLYALEVLDIRSTGEREAIEKLENYAHGLSQSRTPAHPLLLVALARCAAKKTASSSSTAQAKDLLVCFGKMFPTATQKWLTDADRVILTTVAKPVVSSTAKAVQLSPLQIEWQQLQQTSACQSTAMNELLTMVGLHKVKQSALQLFKSALALQKMTPELQQKNRNLTLNYVFTGNPGTGKTTVAKLFARILVDSKMRRNANIEMCGPQQLKDDGAPAFKARIAKAMGGVLFIDEAYELEPLQDPRGKPILAELLLASEELRHDLSFILAGYEDDIQNKLYAYNDGLRSRFVEVAFDDFDESDLRVLWDDQLTQRGWSGVDASVCAVACRRLVRAANRKGFGNARAVRQMAELAIQAAMARDDYDGTTLTIKVVDIIGERPTQNPKLAALLKEIDAKIGWTRIKMRVHELVDQCDSNYEREMAGAIAAATSAGVDATQQDPPAPVTILEPIPVLLHRLFLGNPGTGKTTFASFYGRLLKHLHLLSNGDVVKKTASDFIGQYIGQSQTKTNEILKQAKGKVLIIDEAYNLSNGMNAHNSFGSQALDVLVEKIQGTESDDMAVILIGYEKPMSDMIGSSNPGLARRFPMAFAFFFDDYNDSELLGIFAAACAKQHVVSSTEVDEAVVQYLGQQRELANFGNAGAVEQLLKNATTNAMARDRKVKQQHGRVAAAASHTVQLLVEDLLSETMRRSGATAGNGNGDTRGDPLALLDGLYRMDNIRRELSRMQKRIRVAQQDGEAQPPVGHFVFRGSPGTGKTTVARVMGSILFHMGVLSSARVVETTGLAMTGEYLGQTKKKVETLLQEARGAILFIDEAYALGDNGKIHGAAYGEEALTTLVAAMTDPTYKGLVVVIAGYAKEMDDMLDRNAGLKSRFKRFIDFEDWGVDDCQTFILDKATKQGFVVEASAQLELHNMFTQLRTLPGFGNGRDGCYVWDCLMECRAERVCDHPETCGEQRMIQASDARETSRIVLKARAPPSSTNTTTSGSGGGGSSSTASFPAALAAFMQMHGGMAGFLQQQYPSLPLPHGLGGPGSLPASTPFSGYGGNGFMPPPMMTPLMMMQQQQQQQASQFLQQGQSQSHFPSQSQSHVATNETRPVEELLDEDSDDDSDDDAGNPQHGETRDAGVSDAVWRELQKAKADYQQLLNQMLQEEAARKAREEAERKQREYEELLKKMKEEAERKEAERKLREQMRLEAERKEAERKQREHQELLKKMKQEAERKEAERKRRELMRLEAERQEDERKQREHEELQRKMKEEAERKEAERKRREHLAHLEKLRLAEEAARKLREDAERKVREYEEKRERLRRLQSCPAGYAWFQCGGGWRCGGGSHFVSDAELERNFTTYS